MPRRIEGGVIMRFGPRMPLPSDMHDGMQEPVEALDKLWRMIFREKINKNDRELMQEIVNEFFSNLPKDQKFWLEGYDPKLRKPRSILVKERAMQVVQIAQTSLKKRHRRNITR